MTDREALRRIGFWCNRANDAYAMGEAPWVKNDEVTGIKGDLLTGYVAIGLEAGDSLHDIAVFIENIAKGRGIDPKRHRWHATRS